MPGAQTESQDVMDGFECYEDARGFSLLVPIGWEQVVDLRADTAFVAVEPDRGAGFRANLVVTIEELPSELNLIAWQAMAEPMLQRVLGDYLLIDLEHLDDNPDDPAIRRLMHHVVEESGPITAEEWSSARGAMGYTLTCSISTPAYDSLADVLTEVGHSWRLTS